MLLECMVRALEMFTLSAPLANKRIGMFNILLLEQRIMSLSMREHLRLGVSTLNELVPELLRLEISRRHLLRGDLDLTSGPRKLFVELNSSLLILQNAAAALDAGKRLSILR